MCTKSLGSSTVNMMPNLSPWDMTLLYIATALSLFTCQSPSAISTDLAHPLLCLASQALIGMCSGEGGSCPACIPSHEQGASLLSPITVLSAADPQQTPPCLSAFPASQTQTERVSPAPNPSWLHVLQSYPVFSRGSARETSHAVNSVSGWSRESQFPAFLHKTQDHLPGLSVHSDIRNSYFMRFWLLMLPM